MNQSEFGGIARDLHLLCLRQAESQPLEQLTAGERNVGHESWSPDGNSLAFGDTEGDNASVIHILDLKTRRVSTVP
jgi:Tol biopolymer transport system component